MPVDDAQLIRRGLRAEYVTLSWNVVGIVILAFAALTSRSLALGGFGLDSLIEIGASTVVVWELTGRHALGQVRAQRVIAVLFALIAVYLIAQAVWALDVHHRPSTSWLGAAWTGVTVVAMFWLAAVKGATGRALEHPVLITESRVTQVDGLLAAAVFVGVGANALFHWWWADAVAGLVIAGYALNEVRHAWSHAAA
ncbi:MAG: cation transporter [Acidimicrobiaceae bacterium]|nr:cation transporter [Acidimicrobiaceae bacterium]